MKLVDTASWVHQLREGGDATVRRRVEALLVAGEACWCAMVRTELWIGARGDREKKILREYEGALPELEITSGIWDEACDLARRARAAGLTCPAPDVIIAACAQHHRIEVESADSHFARLMTL